MQEILLALATEEMVLARAVMTPEGRVLCGEGTKLSNNLIDRLRKMEISHIQVKGRPLEMPGEKTLPEELADVDARFSKVTEIPPLMYLKSKVKEMVIASRRK